MNRCVYCGHRCYGGACQYHADLARIERAALTTDPYAVPLMRDELREATSTRKGKGS